MISQETYNKWKPILESDSPEYGPAITNVERAKATAQLLENAQKALSGGTMEVSFAGQMINEELSLQEAAPENNTGGIDKYDPVLINMIRRTAPNLVAFDIMGVQPMTGPTGQIFAMRAHYANNTGDEAFYNEANTGFSSVTGGSNTVVGDATLNLGTTPTGNSQTYNYAGGSSTAQGEAMGSSGNVAIAEMAVSIDKVTVEAKTTALKAEYTQELAQDLKAIHGLDAEKELSTILSTELVSEINREAVRSVFLTATAGSQQSDMTAAGTFDLTTDSNGRWMGEKFAGMHMQISREANEIAKGTRRGRGNILITSSDVASALQMAGVLKYNEASANLTVDDTGVTFVGTINGTIRVYIDPYAASNFFVAGYKGANSWDAGLYYCPYTPLQMVRAVGENNLQPKIGFRTRYGMVANPFSRGATASDGTLVQNANVYYRRTAVQNLM